MFSKAKCACAQRTGAAALESLQRDRPGGRTSPAFTLAAAPVLSTHAVVTVVKLKKITPKATQNNSTSCHEQHT